MAVPHLKDPDGQAGKNQRGSSLTDSKLTAITVGSRGTGKPTLGNVFRGIKVAR